MEIKKDRINQSDLLNKLINKLMDEQHSLYEEYKRIYEDNYTLSYSAKVSGFRSEYSIVMHALQLCTETLVVARHKLIERK